MRIASGDWALAAAPERGGAILSLTRGGADVLRPAPAEGGGAFDLACFPLVPYVNRIGFGTFDWAGRTHHLAPNHPGQAHPLHGIGWLLPWTTTRHDDASIAMRLDHAGDATWPWAFAAEQRLSLSADGLVAELDIANAGTTAMPASLGFHPYFPLAEALRFDSSGVWLADEERLPSTHAPEDALGDWARDGRLSRPDLVDHCYTGWSGSATIIRDAGDIVVEADGAPALHVYVPPGEDFFCIEPMTTIPDAVNRGAAEALQPGETARIAMRIRSA